MASMRGFSASVRRLVKAGETSLRSRRWSAPYAVNMLVTPTQELTQLSRYSPAIQAGRWRFGSMVFQRTSPAGGQGPGYGPQPPRALRESTQPPMTTRWPYPFQVGPDA